MSLKKTIARSSKSKPAWAAALLLFTAPLAVWAYLAGGLFLEPPPYRNFSGPVQRQIHLDNPDVFRLAVMGDCQDNMKVLRAILDDAEARADAAVIMGDLVQRGLKVEYRLFLDTACRGRARLPVYTGIGNHDLDARDSGDLYRSFFGEDRFWWRFGPALFIMINSVERGRWSGELDWLTSVLEDHSEGASKIFVMTHKPPYFTPEMWSMSEDRSRLLMERLSPHRDRVTILAGHYHAWRELEKDGIPVIITGEAGALQVDPEVSYGYLLIECGLQNCKIERRALGPLDPGFQFKRLLFVDWYWGWLGLSIVGLIAVLVLFSGRAKGRSESS